ncbi:MAG: nitrate reductase associated protein [Myxococcota bacterium]
MIFRFESPEAHGLDHLPLAARRALDRAGLKLGLAAWTALPLATRERLVALGAEETVDEDAVKALLAGAAFQEIRPRPEPARPADVGAEDWAGLTPLGRFAVAHHARKGRAAMVRRAIAVLLHS